MGRRADSRHSFEVDSINFIMKYLVELPDGNFVRKEKSELLPTDLICFDGPDADADIHRANAWLQTQIEKAGGLQAWRKASAGRQPMTA